jgi:hypothetical protein
VSSFEPRQITLEQLPELRRKTEAVSRYLHQQLLRYLDTIRPILEPARLLGATGGRGWMERSAADLRQSYEEFGRHFKLRQEFDHERLAEGSSRFEVTPWEYVHEASGERGTRQISMTVPTRWALTYGAEYDFPRMKRVVAGREQGQPEFVHHFVILALLLKLVLSKSGPIIDLLSALRFKISIEAVPELHNLPIGIVEFALPSFRPPDDLILTATALSGVPAFIELIDTDAMGQLEDPVKADIERLIR